MRTAAVDAQELALMLSDDDAQEEEEEQQQLRPPLWDVTAGADAVLAVIERLEPCAASGDEYASCFCWL